MGEVSGKELEYNLTSAIQARPSIFEKILTTSKQSVRRLVGWVPQHPLVVSLILVNIVFLFLPFYDGNNIPEMLSFVSHLDSNVPAFSFTTWPGGPFISAVWTPAYVVYLATGNSLYWSYTTVKVINFLFVGVLAFALWRTIPQTNRKVALGVVLFTVGNPAWIFVNYVWVIWDIVPVALLALGYVMLRYPRGKSISFRVLLLAGSCIIVSIFFYWVALAIVPTLLYYSKDHKTRANIFLTLLGLGALMAFVLVQLMGGGLGSYTSALVGSSTLNRSAYFGLQYFIRFTSLQYIALLGIVVLLLPLALRKMGFSEPVTIFTVLMLFLFTSAVPTPDNYMFVFPFAVLSMVSPRTQRIPWSKLWVSIALPLVALTFLNMIINNAQPTGVGVFFWGYDMFHSNVVFIAPASFESFLLAYNEAMALAATIAILLVIGDSHRNRTLIPPFPSFQEISYSNNGLGDRVHLSMVPRKMGPMIAILAVCIAASFAMNALLPNAIQYDGRGTPPIYAMMPQFIPSNGNAVDPIPGYSYSSDGPQINIFSSAPPFSFNRWFQGQVVTLKTNESLGGALPPSTSVLGGGPFKIDLLNLTGPNATTATLVQPTTTENVSILKPPTFPILGRTDQTYGFENDSRSSYFIDSSQFLNRSYAFAYNVSVPARVGTTLTEIMSATGFVSVVSYPYASAIVYANSSTVPHYTVVPIQYVQEVGAWSYLEFHATPKSFTVNLCGHVKSIMTSQFNGGLVDMRLGVPFNGNDSADFALVGATTSVYSISSNSWPTQQLYDFDVHDPSFDALIPRTLLAFSMVLQDNDSATELSIDGHRFVADATTSNISIGKLTPGQYSVNLTIDELAISQTAPNHYALIPVFWTMVSPYLLLAAVYRVGSKSIFANKMTSRRSAFLSTNFES
jgi:hypothetical protein